MKAATYIFCLSLSAAVAGIASADSAPATAPAQAEPHIRTLFYNPDQVALLDAVAGYQMMIRFGADERIENVSIGDGSAWQVTPNKKATLLFIKPLEMAAHTNMTVVTNRRSYLFELKAHPVTPSRLGYLAYMVRFTYPPEAAPPAAPAPPPPPERRNTAYTYTGSRATLPSLVFDDGRLTYFRWPDDISTPALFLVAADGSESIVNYSVHDGYQVVEQVAPRFVLRNGKDVTTIINDGWREPSPDAGAPRPHDAKTAREATASGTRRR
jgi:type IV secretion system protein VirB9